MTSFCSTSSSGVSRVPAAALARTFESAAAISDCKRPSLDNRCANFAISLSYSSHSGIWRARASLGSFCGHLDTMFSLTHRVNTITAHTVNGFWHKSMVLARCNRSLLPVNYGCVRHFDQNMQQALLTPRFTLVMNQEKIRTGNRVFR